MKRKDFIKQLNEKTAEELKVYVIDMRKDLEKKKIELAFGKSKDQNEIRKLNQNIAQALTIYQVKLSEKDIILGAKQ
jgi:ribosomal protein L29